MKFEILIVVWGADYVQMFTDICLPSLLASGNLPHWPHLNRTSLVIYTTEDDRKQIIKTKVFKAVQEQITVVWRIINVSKSILLGQNNYKHMIFSTFHFGALKEAHERQSAVIILPPDNFLSSGSFLSIAKQIELKTEIVLLPSLKITTETALPQLKKRIATHHILDMSVSECIKLFTDHMAEDPRTSFVDYNPFTTWPSHLHEWIKKPDSFTAHCFHLHPLFIAHPKPMHNLFLLDSVDGDYLQQFDDQRDKIALLGGADLAMMSFQSVHHKVNSRHMNDYMREAMIKDFAYKHCSPIHRWFFTHRFVFDVNASSEDQ